MEAILINPPHPDLKEEEKELNLSTAYLAGALRAQGYETKIIDASLANLTVPQVVAQVIALNPRLVGISIWMHRLLPQSKSLIDALRQAGYTGHICIGGHTPTFAWQELLAAWPNLDSIALGEGESVIIDLARALRTDEASWQQVPGLAYRNAAGQPITSAGRNPLANLDELPQPAWDMVPELKKRGQFISLATSRGCYGRCTFCSINSFYRSTCTSPWRAHSPARVLQEMERLIREHGITRIGFRDDNFMGPGRKGQERARAIAAGIIERGWQVEFYISCRSNDVEEETFAQLKQAGLARVFLGIESGQQQVLDWFNKLTTVAENERALALLEKLEIPVTIGFIMFTPHTKWRDFTFNVRYLLDRFGSVVDLNESINDLFNALEIYPGTELVEILQQEGLLDGSTLAGYTYRFQDKRVALAHRAVQALRRRR